MKKSILIGLLISLSITLWGQDMSTDSVATPIHTGEVHYHSDTIQVTRHTATYGRKPIAMRSVWLGAICPGLGQIYNESYWKLPIVYGGFMGCAYAITWNNSRYTDYKQAYRDLYTDAQNGIVDASDPGKSYNQILPEGYTIDRMGGTSSYIQTLQRYQNNYRRYRDLSIAATAIVYLLTLVDAYVDAQLFDFDISPDLSVNLSPQLNQDAQQRKSAELRLAITF